MRVGLRARLVAAFVAVALLSSMAASGIAYLLVRRAMLQRTQDSILTEFKTTLSRMTPPRLPVDREILMMRVSRELDRTQGRGVWTAGGLSERADVPYRPGARQVRVQVDIYSPSVPVSAEFMNSLTRRTAFQRVVFKNHPYLLVGTRMPSFDDRGPTSITVVMAVSLRKEAADLRAFTRAILLADAVALVIALGLALLAAKGVLHPVRRLAGAARALGEGRLSARVQVRGGDELADLASTFNRSAAALEDTVAELRAMEAASRRFVADVSHELRTPLTAMVAVTDVLTEETTASADTDAAVRIVVEETHRLRRLVEHLIEISRFDAKTAELVPDEVVIGEAVTAALEVRGWADRVEVEGPGRLVARLDPRRFDVIIANLVGNALKHGGPPVRVRFGLVASADPPEFQLVVSDDGPGIPDELLPLVFDRFVKADSARSRSDGSGLGLSIALANTVLHGGTLTAANATGAGAVFTLRLPAGLPEPAGEPNPWPAPEPIPDPIPAPASEQRAEQTMEQAVKQTMEQTVKQATEQSRAEQGGAR